MALGFTGDEQHGAYNITGLRTFIDNYDTQLAAYNNWMSQVSKVERSGHGISQNKIPLQEGKAVATPFFPYYESVINHDTNVTVQPGLNYTVDVYRKIVNGSRIVELEV